MLRRDVFKCGCCCLLLSAPLSLSTVLPQKTPLPLTSTQTHTTQKREERASSKAHNNNNKHHHNNDTSPSRLAFAVSSRPTGARSEKLIQQRTKQPQPPAALESTSPSAQQLRPLWTRTRSVESPGRSSCTLSRSGAPPPVLASSFAAVPEQSIGGEKKGGKRGRAGLVVPLPRRRRMRARAPLSLPWARTACLVPWVLASDA